MVQTMRKEHYIETYDDKDGDQLFLEAHGMVAKLYRDEFDETKTEEYGYFYVIEKEDKKWRMWNGGEYGIVWVPAVSVRMIMMMTKEQAKNNLRDAISAMMSMALNRDRINTFWDWNQSEARYDDEIRDGRSWYNNPKWLEENGNE